jgi:manganese/zinc/iron transport system permease protein
LIAGCAAAGDAGPRSIRDTSIDWPTWAELWRVLTLADYNTRIVVLGTMLLGLAAGIVGTYMLLRKRALIGDAVSHATLPGIGIAFMVMVALGGTGKFLPGLLIGATITGLVGAGLILLIRNMTRLKEDAALGIVLSVFFGMGVAILGVIQGMQQGNAAGLESFIYGKTASMIGGDVRLIAWAAGAVVVLSILFYKEFAILCFDQAYADVQGWPVHAIDVLMMSLVIGVAVIGLQAVGLILMVAMLIIPAAAARFWTQHLAAMLTIAGLVGAASGMLGSALSALVPRLPAGAVIVTVAAGLFLFSLIFGVRRGVLVRAGDAMRLRRRVARQHLLRALYEWMESRGGIEATGESWMPLGDLLAARSWTAGALGRELARARRADLVEPSRDGDGARLTEHGLRTAARVVRNHRLWELYLITHADIAPSHVDRDADQIEHVLGAAMIERLEGLLAARLDTAMPPSPHLLAGPGGGAT